MDTLLYDARTAARRLLDALLLVLATLGLVVGIGASAAFISTVSSSGSAHSRTTAASRLVEVAAPAPASCPTVMSSPDFLDYQAATAADGCSRS